MSRSVYYLSLSGDIKCRYDEKIKTIDNIDPYALVPQECSLDPGVLPNITQIDLFYYLILTHSYYTREQLKAYKSLQAFKQYESGSIQYLSCKQIKEETFVISKVRKTKDVLYRNHNNILIFCDFSR